MNSGNNRVEIENLKAHCPLLMNFQFQENHKLLSTLPQNNKKKEKQKFAQPKWGEKSKVRGIPETGKQFLHNKNKANNPTADVFTWKKWDFSQLKMGFSAARSGVKRNRRGGSAQNKVGFSATRHPQMVDL